MPIPLNNKSLAQLPNVVSPEDRPFAYIIAEQYRDKEGNPTLFEFYANPETITQTIASRYTESSAVGVSNQTLQWARGENTEFTVPDLYMNAHYLNKSIMPLLESLEKLVKEREPGKRQPYVVYLRWGGRSIGPLVITDCEIEEDGWINGLASSARVSLTFKKIPRPDEQRSIKPEATLNPATILKPELPVSLSAGVQTQGSKKVSEYLKNNATKIAGTLGSAVKKGSGYFTRIDPKSGVVTLGDAKKNSGVVGVYDGKELYTLDKIKATKNETVRAILKAKASLNSVYGKTVGELLK